MRCSPVLVALITTFAGCGPAPAGGFVTYGDQGTFIYVMSLIMQQRPTPTAPVDEPCRQVGDVAECRSQLPGAEPATMIVAASKDRFSISLLPYAALHNDRATEKFAEVAVALQYGENSSLFDRFPKPLDIGTFCAGARGALLPAHDECVVSASPDGIQAIVSVVQSIIGRAPELPAGGGLRVEWMRVR